MEYRVFSRRWWSDAKRTKPMAGRKTHICFAASESEARQICQEHNYDAAGNWIQRAYGTAYEYERV